MKSKQQIETERKAIKAIVGNIPCRLTHRQHKRFGDVWGEETWTVLFPERENDLSQEAFDKLVQYANTNKLNFQYISTDANGRRWIA